MELPILCFGITKEITGSFQIRLVIPAKRRVGDLLADLFDRYPALARLNSLRIAVNNEYASPDQLLHDGDEIALIPPVSGG